MADTRRSRSSFSRPSITDVSVASADRLKPAARILVTALVDVLPQEKLSGAEVHALVEAILLVPVGQLEARREESRRAAS